MNRDQVPGVEPETTALVAEQSTAALINAAEIEQQIATARKYPRNVTTFRQRALSLVTLNEAVARECVYALPRDGKLIQGPSARFAEVVASQWGNSRAGARVVDEGPEFVTAQGVFHDLESNFAVTFEVQRRITNSKGKRYSADMIGVTANAACSIALRNVILKGVPKAFWSDIYQRTIATIAGDVATLEQRRAHALEEFKGIGVAERHVYAILGVQGPRDITLQHLVTLAGVFTALREGDTTLDELLAEAKASGGSVQMPTERHKAPEAPNAVPPAAAPPAHADAATTTALAPEPASGEASSFAEGAGGAAPAPAEPAQASPPLPAAAAGMSPVQQKILRASLDRAGIKEAEFTKAFGKPISGLAQGEFNAAMDKVLALAKV